METIQNLIVKTSITISIILGIIFYALTAGYNLSTSPAAVDPNPQKTAPLAQNPDLSPGDCTLSRRFPAAVTQWCGLIMKYAIERSLEPDLLAALILQESGGNPLAYSRSGAVGLMQVMPRDGLAASFQCVNGPCFASRPSIADLQDPEFNISYGTRMLADLKNKMGNLREALRRYGPMDIGYAYADQVLAISAAYTTQ